MPLVDYDSSDESAPEDSQPSKSTKPVSRPSTRPAFQKLVDSSNPNKIKINLVPTHLDKADEAPDEPPSKRVKVGGGLGLKDFNSFLPAPKRAAPQAKGGLGRGVNLKTGSAPAFSREPVEAETPVADEVSASALNEDHLAEGSSRPEGEGLGLAESALKNSDPATLKKKAAVFKPLSVARKPQRKKPPLPTGSISATGSSNIHPNAKANDSIPPPKISLFSTHDNNADRTASSYETENTKHYEPMLYQPPEPDIVDAVPNSFAQIDTTSEPAPESLDAIATSLNLSASQRRQLFGRNANNSSAQAIKVTNFNTDEEYAANEVLRQNGETVQHKAVRPIQGGGKHSLRQLVSSAVGQKDALDEKFADGSRNRKEGAGKYGW